MKKIVSIILLLSMIGGTYAQKDTLAKSGKIRPSVEVFAGCPMSKFYLMKEYSHKTPYTAGALAGISIPQEKGYLFIHSGFIVEGTSMKYFPKNNLSENDYSYHAISFANIPVMVGFDGFITKKLSLSGDYGMMFTWAINRTEYVVTENNIEAKPMVDGIMSRNDLMAPSIVGRLGFSYWFHPRFALKLAVSYKYYCCLSLFEKTLLKPTVSATIGISFR